MHEIENLKQKLCRELDEYAMKGKLDVQSLQIIDTIAHTVKNLNKIIESEEEKYSEGPRIHGNYSFAGGNNSGGNYSGAGSNGGGNYSSAGNYNNGWGGYNYNNRNMGDWRMNDYSMAGRYSTGNEVMVNRLRDLMKDAPDDKTRQEFQIFIDRMERM